MYETRLKFLENGEKEGKGAPMSCAMVYWGKSYERFFNIFLQFGAIVDLRKLAGKKIGSQINIKKKQVDDNSTDQFNYPSQLDLL